MKSRQPAQNTLEGSTKTAESAAPCEVPTGLDNQNLESLATSVAPAGAVKASGESVDPGAKTVAWLEAATAIADSRPAPAADRRDFLDIRTSLQT
jgi:hypothetical protein